MSLADLYPNVPTEKLDVSGLSKEQGEKYLENLDNYYAWKDSEDAQNLTVERIQGLVEYDDPDTTGVRHTWVPGTTIPLYATSEGQRVLSEAAPSNAEILGDNWAASTNREQISPVLEENQSELKTYSGSDIISHLPQGDNSMPLDFNSGAPNITPVGFFDGILPWDDEPWHPFGDFFAGANPFDDTPWRPFGLDIGNLSNIILPMFLLQSRNKMINMMGLMLLFSGISGSVGSNTNIPEGAQSV